MSKDDINLFRSSVGKVTPVKHDKAIIRRKISYAKPQVPDSNKIELSIEASPTSYTAVQNETKLRFSRIGVSAKQLNQLKKGELRPQAICDLHHLQEKEAADKLKEFITQAYQADYRVIQIIHGKGNHSKAKVPILKNLVNRQLREFITVLAFFSSPPKDGGAGAVYVLLKRKNK